MAPDTSSDQHAEYVRCEPCGVGFFSQEKYDFHYRLYHVPLDAWDIARELYVALKEQFANPFGVGVYKPTEAALARFEEAAGRDHVVPRNVAPQGEDR